MEENNSFKPYVSADKVLPEFYQDIVNEVWDCSKWTTKILQYKNKHKEKEKH